MNYVQLPLHPIICSYSIVVIDDDEMFCKMMATGLQKAGAQHIKGFLSVAAAKESLMEMPDIIITDEEMGNESGLEVIKMVRTLNAKAEVIMVSGSSHFAISQEAMRAGAFDFLRKDEQVIGRVIESLNNLQNLKSWVQKAE